MAKKKNNHVEDLNTEETESTREAENTEEAETPETTPELTLEESLQAEVANLVERNMRLAAEYDNYRKRTQRERENIYPEATASVVTKLLPVLDNFGRALETPCSDETFFKGIEMIYSNLWEILQSLGVEEIGVEGESFDPVFHNAVMHIDDENREKNVVAQVLQKGYKLGERVLRPAMVQVAN